MDTIEYDQAEPETTETSPFQQICPRHGEKVHPFHGCSKCVMEEVRRHERRIGALFECEVPIPVDAVDKANELLAEINRGITPE